jgi:serine/threonine protein kinase/tetratricopeptide (TPR) repeat protein
MNESRTLESASVEGLVGQIADEFTHRLNRGEQPEIDEYAVRYPQIATLLREVLPALNLIRLPRMDVALSGAAAGSVADVALPLGDYRILREIGRGGMGVVYEAEQMSLGRRVALKVLPLAAALDAKQLQRFKNEAQAAAHLHHTNIVPVFGIGCERGVHYYAMQFIEGQTLAQVIADSRLLIADLKKETNDSPATRPYQAKPQEEIGNVEADLKSVATVVALSTERSVRSPAFFRTVANLGIQAALALEHAHQLGVIHRDIKPANLMVDERGNLWITDFGLAHCQSQAGLTMTGDLVGTLRYMSPEQALAKRVDVDHRTDIYSLGATLYELLTLGPAYSGRDRQELLRQIAFEEPCAPRRLSKSIPSELETIVLKAMEKSPSDRYATAQEVADDLRRFLEDKPILARRPTLLQRARKLRRRHPGVTLTAGASALVMLFLAVLGLAVNNRSIRREQERTGAANDRLKENLQLAMQTLEEVYLKVVEEHLPRDPTREKKDQDLLKKALGFYDQFAEKNRGDPTVRKEVGRAYRRAGRIHELLGENAQAEQAYERAILIAEQVAAEFPAEPDYRWALADAHNRQGIVLRNSGRWRAAEMEYCQAISLLTPLIAEWPRVPLFRATLADSNNYLGELLFQDARNFKGAEEHKRRSIDLWTQLVAESPTVAYHLPSRWEVANVHNGLGGVLREEFELDAAENQFRQEISHLTQLLGEGAALPQSWPVLRDLATARNNLGNVLRDKGEARAAEEEYRQAISHLTEVVNQWRSVPQFRAELGIDHYNLALGLRDKGAHAEAEDRYREAIKYLGEAVSKSPSAPAYAESLGDSHRELAHLLNEQGNGASAAEHCRKALALYAKLAADFPETSAYLNDLARLLVTCPAPQFRDADRALRIAKRAVELSPEHSDYWNTLAVAHYRAGDWEATVAAMKRAMHLGKSGNSCERLFLAMAHWQLGDKELARRCYDEALQQIENNKAQHRPLSFPRNADQDKELRRFRAEAAALLDLPASSSPESGARKQEAEDPKQQAGKKQRSPK